MVLIINATDRFLAVFFAALATGIYLCTLAYCIRWLVYTDEGWKIRKRINKTMLSGTLSIFILSSIHTSFAVATSFETIRHMELGIVDDPNVALPWTAVVLCTMANTVVLIADGFLIYRCWLVCFKSFSKIIFPCFFWVGGVVCTVLQAYWQIVQSAAIVTAWTPVNMDIGPGTILTPFWGSTIVVNVYATSVIVYTLWKTARRDESKLSESTGQLLFIMRVIIESGALYLIMTIPHFIVWWTPSGTAILILGWINVPVVGSAFNLIILRTSWHRAKEEGIEELGITAIQFNPPTGHSETLRTKDDTSSTAVSVTY
ncbi:hypothetical protein GALMADRAFT_137439 [Galerina marginata CBS 339.88]|uniref:G-protein coupled receptors family 1 profile domain-containing protein n=1 Tax=Galerina marginata (strain CBS 339.88) TaxID=685588 RepID=A0A067T8W4_GALM3|nr:hypothetical protein GALMADRAFT_137439 [Galerina marginata CBS 339.88]